MDIVGFVLGWGRRVLLAAIVGFAFSISLKGGSVFLAALVLAWQEGRSGILEEWLAAEKERNDAS